MAEGKTFLFCFPFLPGHINPTFPVTRELIAKGHKVHYISRDMMQPAIEAAGATFHNELEVYKTMMEGRQMDQMGFGVELKPELGLAMDIGWMKGIGGTQFFQYELKLADLVGFVKEMKPHAIMYCPMLNPEGGFVGKVCGIPAVSLTTVAGPGSLKLAYTGLCAMDGLAPEDLYEWRKTCTPRNESKARLNDKYGLGLPADDAESVPLLGLMEAPFCDKVSLVTTVDSLMEPMTPELAAFYEAGGVKWEGVGPLLDGGSRAGAMIKAATDDLHAAEPDKVLAAVQQAKKAGRLVVCMSMGTMVTGDDPDLGWEAQNKDADGGVRGLANKEVVRTAWAGVFDAAGKPRDHSGPLIVVSIGSQKDALGDIEVPANAICQQSIPQLDILREGVDCFIMGGGQNGFQEGLMHGAPFVVVPVVSDQVVTGGIVEGKGFGKSIPRPDPSPEEKSAATAKYRADIAAAVDEVLGDKKYMEKVKDAQKQFDEAKGVERVVEILCE